ncbi:MAG: hypothetical protein IJ187_02190 [Neisseriaceae bacterium]|nr:hypothetical protein [Neisseriaceae bacterium]MBQ9723809.1 hypothetical protein [Neisseriaceae bacterium]
MSNEKLAMSNFRQPETFIVIASLSLKTAMQKTFRQPERLLALLFGNKFVFIARRLRTPCIHKTRNDSGVLYGVSGNLNI